MFVLIIQSSLNEDFIIIIIYNTLGTAYSSLAALA